MSILSTPRDEIIDGDSAKMFVLSAASSLKLLNKIILLLGLLRVCRMGDYGHFVMNAFY